VRFGVNQNVPKVAPIKFLGILVVALTREPTKGDHPKGIPKERQIETPQGAKFPSRAPFGVPFQHLFGVVCPMEGVRWASLKSGLWILSLEAGLPIVQG